MNNIREGYKMTVFGEIPEAWSVVVLGECSNITKLAGFEFTEYMEYIDDGEIIALRALNLKNGKLDLEDIKKIDRQVSESLTRSKLYINDVLFSYVGTVGEVALIEENDKFHLAPNVAKITFNDSIFPKFALQYLMSSNMKNEINKYVTTTSQPALSMENIRKIKMIVPTKKEQEKIASILLVVDEQIKKIDALIEKNKELKKGLMQTLLTKGIGHTKFKKTEIGEIPEEWEVRHIEEICEILDSKRVPLNEKQRSSMGGDIPYYGANAIVDYINDYLFDDKLILIAEDGGNFSDFRDKPIAFYVEGKCWVNNHAHVLRAKISESTRWIFYSLVHKDITNIVQGGTRAKLNQKDLRGITIAFPKLEEQIKIVNILFDIDSKIDIYISKKYKLEQVKKGLMQKLLTGKIRVI